MAQQAPQALATLARLQHLINTHQSLLDSIETISVTPKAELRRGEPDWTHPYIEVRARKLEDSQKEIAVPARRSASAYCSGNPV